ncbi:MAG TPA: SelB C-terminal domain-containing protein [Verrucomicrobiae bacterium]|jgi:selenocysteine-specific elongation factor|nr:SelB C-terminal domain-containing protein [Verrucomicrobiae bacterium]
MGATSLALSRELGIGEGELISTLRDYDVRGLLIYRDGYITTADFEPHLSNEQSAFFDATVAVDPLEPNRPTPRPQILAAIGSSQIAGLSRALDTLLTRGRLVEVGDSVYCDRQIARIRESLEAFLNAHPTMTVAQFRDLLGTSRRYAVPLLEWFDARGITAREGGERVLPNCPP